MVTGKYLVPTLPVEYKGWGLGATVNTQKVLTSKRRSRAPCRMSVLLLLYCNFRKKTVHIPDTAVPTVLKRIAKTLFHVGYRQNE